MARSVTQWEFIEAWERALHPHDVDDKFGQRRGWASDRASRYRARGIDLKKFKGTHDVERLNARIAQMRGEGA